MTSQHICCPFPPVEFSPSSGLRCVCVCSHIALALRLNEGPHDQIFDNAISVAQISAGENIEFYGNLLVDAAPT